MIERYRRRESSVEEALVEMYVAGVGVRRVEDISQALLGARSSTSTVSELNQKIAGRIQEWRERAIEGKYPYVYLGGTRLKRWWAGEVRNVAVLVAIGVNAACQPTVKCGSPALLVMRGFPLGFAVRIR